MAKDKRFEKVHSDGAMSGCEIWVDTQTGVQYFFRQSGYAGGITVLVDADDIGTFIFDEIDTGVSGRTARKVGEKMRFLGGKRQILCITHLPQIAAMADSHFLIEKESNGEETTTKVTILTEEGSVGEVARLMGGSDVTETTLAAARELIAEK